MYVARLELHQFRNYAQADVSLTPGVTIFQGSNGQGKTNLVEAVEYLSRLGSHRVSSDGPLVQAGTEQAVIRAEVVAGLDDARRLLLELEINPGRANRARINRELSPARTICWVHCALSSSRPRISAWSRGIRPPAAVSSTIW